MEIKRDYYLNKLIELQGDGLIKVITGMRRCGKSYLLFTQFRKYLADHKVRRDHVFEMAFDDVENAKYRNPDVFYLYLKEKIKNDGKMFYILLDEIQLLDRFVEVLNSLIRKPNVDVFVTGSNAHLLSKDVITEFRGRGEEIHLNPLNFSEFMSVYKGSKFDGWTEYMMYGGLPPVVLKNSYERKAELLKSLLMETYLKDIIQRNKIRHQPEMEELLDVLASNIGSLTNPLKLSDTFKGKKKVTVSAMTIRKYLEFFEDSFIIERVKRYDIKGRKYINAPYKYYFSDMGIRNIQLNFRQQEETHIMENVLYNELVSRDYGVDVGTVVYSTKDKSGKIVRKQLEVDFVCNKGSRRYYIQSAFALPDEGKRKQEEASLVRINDSFKKIIIVGNPVIPYYTNEGVLVMSIYDFLLDQNSLEKL